MVIYAAGNIKFLNLMEIFGALLESLNLMEIFGGYVYGDLCCTNDQIFIPDGGFWWPMYMVIYAAEILDS